jgi:hypothetical protein
MEFLLCRFGGPGGSGKRASPRGKRNSGKKPADFVETSAVGLMNQSNPMHADAESYKG